MKLFKFLFRLSCIVCIFKSASPSPFSENQTSNSNLRRLIVGGYESSIKDFPFIGAMFQPKICGGSLIHKKYVLTAAHCLVNKEDGEKFEANKFKMRFGSKNRGKDGTVVTFELTRGHPFYNTTRHDYDIGIMKLTSNSAAALAENENVKIIKFAEEDEDFRTGTDVWFAGWGSLVEDGSSPKLLYEAKTSLLDFETCKENYRFFARKRLTDRMICAGTFSGGVDTCQGDSGGPLVTKKNNEYYLIGVTSWGHGCARENTPGISAKISALSYWINSMIEELQDCKATYHIIYGWSDTCRVH